MGTHGNPKDAGWDSGLPNMTETEGTDGVTPLHTTTLGSNAEPQHAIGQQLGASGDGKATAEVTGGTGLLVQGGGHPGTPATLNELGGGSTSGALRASDGGSAQHVPKRGHEPPSLKKPIGVVGCISPWNLPLYLFTWKIAPALAAGNTVVAKPSEITPMTAYLFSEICKEAGLPNGVLNIVHGLGPKVGSAITKHPNIKAISFTGGTNTGREIAKVAAPMFKKLSLELGGKNPNIVFDDCDFEKAVSTSVLSSFSNQGQICLCGSRIFVQRKIYQKFKDKFIEKVKHLSIGDPLDSKTKIGALVNSLHQLHKLQLRAMDN